MALVQDGNKLAILKIAALLHAGSFEISSNFNKESLSRRNTLYSVHFSCLVTKVAISVILWKIYTAVWSTKAFSCSSVIESKFTSKDFILLA